MSQRALQAGQQVADTGDDHLAQGGFPCHVRDHVREVLQHQHGRCTGILQLVAQFVGGVERIGVDDNQPGTQRAQHGDGILRHVGKHQRDALALREPLRLQPRRERGRQPVHLAVSDRMVHQHIGLVIGVLCKSLGGELHQRVVLVRVDVVRHAGRVTLQPDPVDHCFTAPARAADTATRCPARAARLRLWGAGRPPA